MSWSRARGAAGRGSACADDPLDDRPMAACPPDDRPIGACPLDDRPPCAACPPDSRPPGAGTTRPGELASSSGALPDPRLTTGPGVTPGSPGSRRWVGGSEKAGRLSLGSSGSFAVTRSELTGAGTAAGFTDDRPDAT